MSLERKVSFHRTLNILCTIQILIIHAVSRKLDAQTTMFNFWRDESFFVIFCLGKRGSLSGKDPLHFPVTKSNELVLASTRAV